MDKLLTKKDLAERWQLSVQAIDVYVRDGVVVPIKGIPSIRFNLQYIEKIEGCIPEKTTVRERKLEKQLEEVTRERDILKSVLGRINSAVTEVIYTNSSQKSDYKLRVNGL